MTDLTSVSEASVEFSLHLRSHNSSRLTEVLMLPMSESMLFSGQHVSTWSSNHLVPRSGNWNTTELGEAITGSIYVSLPYKIYPDADLSQPFRDH